ncbi:MAG: sulfite exporter TauE/SafE family protein, partial [Planctomycetes bacterium]|nr:sulfite exporter TauE/SafE family protein [Planctomycetota bacterium]
AMVGAACGLLGAAVDLGGSLVGLNRAAAVLAGAMMIAVGLIALAVHYGARLPKMPLPPGLRWILTAVQRAALSLRPFPRALTIGLLTALLPCGWLYAFAVVATGTGSIAMGAAVMVAFWLGTVPVLAFLGIGVQTLTGTLGRRAPLITALVIVLLGLYTVAARPVLSVGSVAPAIEARGGVLQQAESLQGAQPPCCRERGHASEK